VGYLHYNENLKTFDWAAYGPRVGHSCSSQMSAS